MLRVIAGARTEAEADLIVGRLKEAGISAVSQLSLGNPEFGAAGGRTIYVEELDERRAREVLATPEEPFSDDELAQLSEQAWRDAHREG